MVSPTAVALVLLPLLLPISGEDIRERFIPAVAARIAELRENLVPLSESTIHEALFHVGSYMIPVDAESELCKNHSNFMFEAFLNYEFWALRMIDASSKLPSGFMDGNVQDMGNFDQCLSVTAPDQLFRGKHCVIQTKGILPPELLKGLDTEVLQDWSIRKDFTMSLCVPSTCSARDVKTHIDFALEQVNASALMDENSCRSAEPEPFTRGEWAAICVLAGILVLIIASTIYDVNTIRLDKSELYTSFSLIANIRKMVDTSKSTAALPYLNGLRVMGMAYVILGHRFLFMLGMPNIRIMIIVERIHELKMTPFESAQNSVEIFFLMSGLLVSYTYLRYRHKGKRIPLLSFYLLRYARMTPVLAITILLYGTLMIRFVDGPLWRSAFSHPKRFCEDYWWTSLLYIANYTNRLSMCVPHAWYIFADYQLYVFSPLLLIPLHRWPRVGVLLTALALLLTTAAALRNSFTHGLRAGGPVTVDMRTQGMILLDYSVTHLRAASFLIGIYLGYLIFRIRQGDLIVKLSKWKLWLGWTFCLLCIAYSICFNAYFQQPDLVYMPWLESTHLVLHRHVFALGISWIIMVCALGYGGVVCKFLSWKAFIPLARLTFCAYLNHVGVQVMQAASERSVASLTFYHLFYHFAADFLLAYVTAAVLYLAVEGPCAKVVSCFFEGKKERAEELPPVIPVYRQHDL